MRQHYCLMLSRQRLAVYNRTAERCSEALLQYQQPVYDLEMLDEWWHIVVFLQRDAMYGADSAVARSVGCESVLCQNG